MDALTAAKGWASLFTALSSKGSAPVKIENYLPYPDALKDPESGPFKASTAQLLKRLISKSVVPPRMVAELNLIQQIQDAY